jgi:hypothetical protein
MFVRGGMFHWSEVLGMAQDGGDEERRSGVAPSKRSHQRSEFACAAPPIGPWQDAVTATSMRPLSRALRGSGNATACENDCKALDGCFRTR